MAMPGRVRTMDFRRLLSVTSETSRRRLKMMVSLTTMWVPSRVHAFRRELEVLVGEPVCHVTSHVGHIEVSGTGRHAQGVVVVAHVEIVRRERRGWSCPMLSWDQCLSVEDHVQLRMRNGPAHLVPRPASKAELSRRASSG